MNILKASLILFAFLILTLITVILFAIGVTQMAHAEVLPPGCYVATGDTECYEPKEDTFYVYKPSYFTDNQELEYYHTVVASIIDAYVQIETDLKRALRLNRKLKKQLRRK